MSARSIVPILESDRQGQVQQQRDAVFTGRERHVAAARPGNKPYPQRAIRTDQYLYIINFEPQRWPMGTGPGFGVEGEMPDEDRLRENTFAAFGDLDASPTKAWVVTHRQQDKASFDYAVGRRPRYELYNIRLDPHCIKNIADDRDHAEVRGVLHDRLIGEMKRTSDPRVSDDVVFERPPYTGKFEKKKK